MLAQRRLLQNGQLAEQVPAPVDPLILSPGHKSGDTSVYGKEERDGIKNGQSASTGVFDHGVLTTGPPNTKPTPGFLELEPSDARAVM